MTLEETNIKEEESSSDEEMEEDTEEPKEPMVYLPGQALEDNEELVMDQSAYIMYHQAQTGAPCLSFDIIRDDLGDSRTEFPQTFYMVAGTQAERASDNNLIVMKVSNITKNKQKEAKEDDEDEESDSDDDENDKPEMEIAMIKVNGGINRIRTKRLGERSITATWGEVGAVNIWDTSLALNATNDSSVMSTYNAEQRGQAATPLQSFTGHQIEGFALDWSPINHGWLATGDCNKNIHVWKPEESSSAWHIDQRAFSGHTQSVEDIQWSPTEPTVFASCSVDKSIRIWDARAAPNKANMLSCEQAHDSDVNVISWNRQEPLLLSGGDDGQLKVWDLRSFKDGSPVAVIKHHTAPITSVEWHYTDSTVFAAAGEDDQLTLWDLALERDTETTEQDLDIPPQLLFIHQGMSNVKELHWHAQIPGVIVCTAQSGFNIFKTISV